MIWTRWRECTLIPKPAPANLGTMQVYSLYLWILGNIQWVGRIFNLTHESYPPLIVFSHTKVQKVEQFLCISAIRLLIPLKILCPNPFHYLFSYSSYDVDGAGDWTLDFLQFI